MIRGCVAEHLPCGFQGHTIQKILMQAVSARKCAGFSGCFLSRSLDVPANGSTGDLRRMCYPDRSRPPGPRILVFVIICRPFYTT